MKTMIFQVKVGNPPSFYDYCINSVKQYADRVGADHVLLTEPKLKIRPLNSHRSKEAVERLGYLPIFEKENAFEYLGEYDKICIVDSDIYIRDTAPNIFDEIDMDTAFAGVRECDMPLQPNMQSKIVKFSKGQYEKFPDIMKEWNPKHGIPFYNMGLMLFTTKLLDYLNGETPEQFIRRKEFEGFVNGEGHWKWSTDQTLLNYWVKTSGMEAKCLDWKWNALYNGVRDNVIKDAYFIHFFLSAKLRNGGAEIPKIVEKLG